MLIENNSNKKWCVYHPDLMEVYYINTGCGICRAGCGANFMSRQYIKFQCKKWRNIFKFCNFYFRADKCLGTGDVKWSKWMHKWWLSETIFSWQHFVRVFLSMHTKRSVKSDGGDDVGIMTSYSEIKVSFHFVNSPVLEIYILRASL